MSSFAWVSASLYQYNCSSFVSNLGLMTKNNEIAVLGSISMNYISEAFQKSDPPTFKYVFIFLSTLFDLSLQKLCQNNQVCYKWFLYQLIQNGPQDSDLEEFQ